MTGGLAGIVIVADDLSGAAETASALAPGVPGGIDVRLLRPGDGPVDPGPSPVALDTDSRHARPDDAFREVREVLSSLPPGRLLLKKVDSLLRGNIVPELSAIAGSGRTVLFAPALPRLNRVVRDGRPWVDDAPLAHAAAWRLESSAAPTSLREMFPDAVPAPLATVRDASALRRASRAASGSILVCDAETDADLGRIAGAALELSRDREVAVAGSSALAAAIGRLLGAPDDSEIPAGASAVGGRALFVVGTGEPRARAQVAVLQAAGARVLALELHRLLDDDAAPALVAATRVTMEAPVSVLTLADGTRLDARSGAQLCRRLAELVATACSSSPPALLTLTGGETARAVLDALSVRRITVRGTINHGAALSTTDRGMTVVTRPGSFGADDDLLRILERVSPSGYATLGAQRQKGASMSNTTAGPAGRPDGRTPLIAVTMGDGAGVGPEITVAALTDPSVAARCRPVVIGDATRLRQAAGILGSPAEIVTIDDVGQAVFRPGRVNVIDLNLLPEDLPWGEVSPVAGDAAFHYVRVACELAMRGDVDAICTAPLNKAALHAAGHMYPGHTELLAELTGTTEVSMLLSTPKVKVIHVTTHIGLVHAIEKIEPGLVERTVRRGIGAMQGAGIVRPKVGVCAINPHAGENGLFGSGEEAEKITPAIERLVAEGFDVHGPLPADTAFFLAGRGDYDLIVAMYHDQGHAPVKVLGIEEGTNITVGLPVIRTSVDHGTAFDIAGTGKVDVRSMIEALRQAAEMSAARVTAA